MGVAQSGSDGVLDVMNRSLVFWEITTLVVLVAVIVVFVLVVRGLVYRKPATTPARCILDERYARGEVDREEYEQKRRDLRR